MTTPSTLEVGYANGSTGYAHTGWWDAVASNEQAPELRWPFNLTTYDYMRRRDTTAAAALAAVTLPIERTQWRIDGRGCDPRVAAHVAQDFGLPLVGEAETNTGRTKGRFSWHEHLRTVLDMLVFGFMPFEQVYRFDEQGRVRLRKLAPRPPRTVSGIDVARDGGLLGIRQWAGAGARRAELTIPVDRLVMYAYRRDPGSWTGNSVLRPAYKHVLTKDPVLRVWAQLIERTGMGVVTYTGPENPDNPEVDLKQGLAMAQALRAGSQAGAAVPHGAQLQLQGLQGAIPDARAFMQYADDKILESVLANFLKLDGKGGSYALASVQEATFTQSLQALAQQVADTTSQHVIEDLVDVAFGPDELAPRLVFDEIGSRIPLTLEGLVALTQGDRPLLYPDREIEQHLRARLGVPLKGDPQVGAAAEQQRAAAVEQAVNSAVEARTQAELAVRSSAEALAERDAREQRAHELEVARLAAEATVNAATTAAQAAREAAQVQAAARREAAELLARQEPPQVRVDVAPPLVNVAPPTVHTDVTVLPSPPRARQVVRDEQTGRISGVIEVDAVDTTTDTTILTGEES